MIGCRFLLFFDSGFNVLDDFFFFDFLDDFEVFFLDDFDFGLVDFCFSDSSLAVGLDTSDFFTCIDLDLDDDDDLGFRMISSNGMRSR